LDLLEELKSEAVRHKRRWPGFLGRAPGRSDKRKGAGVCNTLAQTDAIRNSMILISRAAPHSGSFSTIRTNGHAAAIFQAWSTTSGAFSGDRKSRISKPKIFDCVSRSTWHG
jgi:hypothetical protein